MSTTGQYGRYSDEEQKPTSIEDQLRNCERLAAREGLTIAPHLRFADRAVTGKAEGTAKRTGYRRLLDAIEAGECTVVIADELSRLTRAYGDGARLVELVESTGVRIITCDGIDTAREGWKLVFMFKLMTAAQEVENTSSRTRRGMLGALHRGKQIAPTPYGYIRHREMAPGGKECTTWSIDEKKATVVRDIFRLRRQGYSHANIGRWLKERGILPPRPHRCKGEPYWRVGTVVRILSNPIYRGTFIWNNSSTAKAEAKKKRKTLTPVAFEREDLRIVSDDLWYTCNERRPTESGEPERAASGGGKHVLSGLVRCGDCKAVLSVGGGPKSFSLHCPQCEPAVRIGGRSNWIGYSSVSAAMHALEFALRQLFTGEVRDEFHQRLRDRLLSGPAQEERELRERVRGLEGKVARLKTLIANPDLGPELFEADLVRANEELRVASTRLNKLQGLALKLTQEVVDAQVGADPLRLLHDVLYGEVQPFLVRATLRRLLATFELVRRPARGCSVFRIVFVPGVSVAELTQTPVVDSSSFGFEVTASTTNRRPAEWMVTATRL